MFKGFWRAPRFYFFPRKLNHCFWQGKHDLVYHCKGIPVNTILLSPSAHSMAGARHNTLFSALNIPFRPPVLHRYENKVKLWIISALVACSWSQIRFFILANVPTCMSEGFWPNFDQINITHRWPCSVWILNLLTWQNAPEGRYDGKSWEMAYNWLMMTSSGNDNWPSGSLGLLTDKTKKTRKIADLNRAFKIYPFQS